MVVICVLVSLFCFCGLDEFVDVYRNVVMGDKGIDLGGWEIGMWDDVGDGLD